MMLRSHKSQGSTETNNLRNNSTNKTTKPAMAVVRNVPGTALLNAIIIADSNTMNIGNKLAKECSSVKIAEDAIVIKTTCVYLMG